MHLQAAGSLSNLLVVFANSIAATLFLGITNIQVTSNLGSAAKVAALTLTSRCSRRATSAQRKSTTQLGTPSGPTMFKSGSLNTVSPRECGDQKSSALLMRLWNQSQSLLRGRSEQQVIQLAPVFPCKGLRSSACDLSQSNGVVVIVMRDGMANTSERCADSRRRNRSSLRQFPKSRHLSRSRRPLS
jgi:hypothetical protein